MNKLLVKIKQSIPAVIFLMLILFIWELWTRLFQIPIYLYPAPSKIIHILLSDLKLYQHALVTIIEAIGGFILGSVLGFCVAIIFSFSKKIESALMPYAILLQVTPIIAIAPLIILWFGNGIPAKIIIAGIICFFPVLVNTLKGLKSVDNNLVKLFKIFCATKYQTLVNLKIPSSLPFLFSALKISSSLSIIGAIVAEFVSASKGIGYYILVNSYQLKTEYMFAAIILSSIIGFLFYSFLSYLEKHYIFWAKGE